MVEEACVKLESKRRYVSEDELLSSDLTGRKRVKTV